jgi:hypothetical protein
MRPLERPNIRWEDNIKMDVREVECERVAYIKLTQNRMQWRGMNISFSRKMRKS